MTGKQKVVVQDNTREQALARYCGLQPTGLREGWDAYDELGNYYELKTSTRGGITTARDVGPEMIAGWRSVYWIIALGNNYEDGFEISELYIAHPNDLEPWFSLIERRILGDLITCQEVIAIARDAGAPNEKVAKIEEIVRRGVTINNPHIPRRIIQTRATKLDPKETENAIAQIMEFVRKHPLGPPEHP